MNARSNGLAIALGARKLPGNEHGHARFVGRLQAKRAIEQCRRIQKRVAVHHAEAREFGRLKAGNHAEHALLLREGEVGLKADEVVARPMRVLGAQLQRGPRAAAGARVGKPNRLERAEARRICALARYLLDGLAGLEQIARLEVTADHTVGGDELGGEALVLVARKRRVEVVAKPRILVTALPKELRQVKRIGHHDGRRRIVKRHMVATSKLPERRG